MSVNVEVRDGTAEVRMQRGPVNAMDVELCRAIADTFAELSEDRAVRAIVLTGEGRAFCAGVDLPRLLDGSERDTRDFLDALSASLLAVHAAPIPTVAAVNGHAIAGGAILAAACDRIVCTDGGARLGLTELQVGVPFPTAAIEIVRARVPAHRFAEVVLHAGLYGPDEARDLGLVDEVVPAGTELERAQALAASLAAIPPSTYALTKQQLQRPVRDAVEARTEDWDPAVHDGWCAPATRDHIARFVEATFKR